MDFWNNVKNELSYKGITQKDLANMSNLNYRTLQNWIARNILPDIGDAIKIAKALNVSAEYLLEGFNYSGLNDEELAVIILFRKLNPENKKVIKYLLNELTNK